MIQLLTTSAVRRPQKDDRRRRICWYTKDLSFRTYTFTEEEYANKELVAAKMEAVATECPPLDWIIHLDWESVSVEKPKGAPRGTRDRKFYQRICRYKEPFLEFEAQSVPLNPYFLGLWLGDGTSRNTTITTMDSEVSDWICEYAEHLGLTVSVSGKRNNKAKDYSIVGRKGTNENRVRMWLRDLQLEKTEKDVDTKHIPVIYLQNSVDVRTQVLAGLIDSDGYKASTTTYEVIQKNTQLSNDIVTLTRSLGFYTRIDARKKTCQSHDFEGDYWSIRISINQTSPKLPIKIPKKQFLGSEQYDNPEIDVNGQPIPHESGQSGFRWTPEADAELLRLQAAHGNRWHEMHSTLLPLKKPSDSAKRKRFETLMKQKEEIR